MLKLSLLKTSIAEFGVDESGPLFKFTYFQTEGLDFFLVGFCTLYGKRYLNYH